MKRIVILLSLVALFTVSCVKSELETQQVPNVSSTPCGVSDPAKNLPWLTKLIETAKTDNTGNYLGRIWLEKFKVQDIFVTDMMLGSGGIAYCFFYCSGNHLAKGNTCPACNFVGNNHFFIKTGNTCKVVRAGIN